VIPRSRAAAQDAAHSTVEITCEMIEAAALVLERRPQSRRSCVDRSPNRVLANYRCGLIVTLLESLREVPRSFA
jgi:hypothetical protein